MVTRRHFEGSIVEVGTEMGRRVRCTPDHPWIVGSGKPDGELRFKLAEELDESDWLPLAQGSDAEDDPALASMLSATDAADLQFEEARVRPSREELATVVAKPVERLPDLIWDQTPDRKRALLSGLRERHGSWSLVNRGQSAILEWGPLSGELADGVMRLLGDIGIVASRRIGRTSKSTKDAHWIRIAGAGYRKFDFGPAWVRAAKLARRPFSGFVYSLEVPVAHTFVTTGGLMVKNCFPKDVSALKQLAGNSGYHFQLLTAVIEVNELQKRRTVSKLKKHLGSLVGKEIALLGVAFKPNTDDIREATSLVLAGRLQGEGANVRAYDPVAGDRAADVFGAGVRICATPEQALEGADGAVLVTEWPEFAELDWENGVKNLMKTPLLVDGRNFLDRDELVAAGFTYEGVGR
jgi:hypothetical protein